MECTIHRRAQFSASHRYWLPELDDAENKRLFGACSRFPGHGHNYLLYVSLAGDLDQYGDVYINVEKILELKEKLPAS